MEVHTVAECEHLLNTLLLSVQSSKSGDQQLQNELSSLSRLIQQTSHSELLREQLARSERSWRLIKIILESELADGETASLKVRLVRGVLMLARNLLSMDRDVAERLQIHSVVFGVIHRVEKCDVASEIKNNVLVSAFELLANFSVGLKRHDVRVLDEVVGVFNIVEAWTKESLFPTFAYLDGLFNDSDFLYEALSKGKGLPVMSVLLAEYEKLELDQEFDAYSSLILRMLTKLLFHESFLKFITVHNTEEDMVRYLKMSQAIITSIQDWEVFEMTVVLSWNFELFQKTLVEIQRYFDTKDTKDPDVIYGKISSVLDVFSTLSHFEHARKFLISYKGVELLVSLLGTIHTNVKPRSKLKDNQKQDDKIRHPRDFPHVKCMIIETLTSLIHENFEVQEQVREIHGLELILSNCIIDDNEPFIKERAIVCLRFLLKDNPKNQEFVAKMEAREVVPNDTLDEAGFEVEIVDGKVSMKQKPKAN